VYEELIQADLTIQNFKKQYNLTDIESDIKYYLVLSGELEPILMETETQLRILNVIVDFINDENNKYELIPLSPSLANPVMAEVIGKYNEALVQRNDMFKAAAQSPLMKELNEQVEVQRVTFMKSIENAKKTFQISLEDRKKKEAEIKNKIGKIPTIEKNFLQLKREQELQQAIYIFLLEMREQTGVKGVSLLPKLQMIDEPYVINKPVEPKLIKVAITALFFGGMVLPLSAIYGFPLVNNCIRRRKEK
jgi:hypothetical protein